MWMMNRKDRYKIIKELVTIASPELINKLVLKTNSKNYECTVDPEYRRKEILDYLEEMNNCWNDNYIDMTDRQYIRILKEEETKEPTKNDVCVIFKDNEEEQKISQICEEITYGKKKIDDSVKSLKKEKKYENDYSK